MLLSKGPCCWHVREISIESEFKKNLNCAMASEASLRIVFLVPVVLPAVLQAVATAREVLELQVSAAVHSVYSGIVYRCSISACKVEGFNGRVYIYISHMFFSKVLCFSVWGSFNCYLQHFGAKISHLHAHLAFGFWFLLVFGFCLQVVSRHRHS